MRSRRFTVLALVLASSLHLVGCASGRAAKAAPAGSQLAFGVQMARLGLWNEAYFRFQQAARLNPDNAHVINNLAVAAEARGKFEEAERYYQQALRLSGADPELKRNYARFVEFYQSYKAREEGGAGATGAQSPPGDG